VRGALACRLPSLRHLPPLHSAVTDGGHSFAAVEHSAAALGVNPPSRVGHGNRCDEAGVGHGRGIPSDEVGEITWAGPLYAA